MRAILFKAKRSDNGEWVIGSYVHTFNEDKKCPVVGVMAENHWIVETSGNMLLIDKETLCQYTGLTDKNGNKIWENDVVKHYCNLKKPESYDIGNIYWDNYNLRFERTSTTDKDTYFVTGACFYEVIGNTIDNPELAG